MCFFVYLVYKATIFIFYALSGNRQPSQGFRHEFAIHIVLKKNQNLGFRTSFKTSFNSLNIIAVAPHTTCPSISNAGTSTSFA
jgi:hypothetical protein